MYICTYNIEDNEELIVREHIQFPFKFAWSARITYKLATMSDNL